MPGDFLDRAFMVDDERRQWRTYFIERETFGNTALSDVEAKDLIAWCEARNDPQAWKAVAAGLRLWLSNDRDETLRRADAAVRFLEASPVPEDILTIYGSNIPPRSWMGSKADVMERRTAMFNTLFQHKNRRIGARAQEIVEAATKQIEIARKRERIEDEGREQRFE